MAKKLYYKIGEACKHLDIQPYVLRYWETEFPMLHPEKSSSGQRVYNERDLATIRRIKELLYDEGYTIAGAKKKLETEDLTKLQEKSADAAPKVAAAAVEPQATADPEADPDGASEQEPEPPKKAAPKKKAAPAKPAPVKQEADEQAAGSAGQAAALRTGIKAAIGEARAILELLD